MNNQTDVRPTQSGNPVLSERWWVFPSLTRDDPILSTDVLRSMPKEIEIGGRCIQAQAVTAPDGRLDLGPLHGGHGKDKTAYIFAYLDVRKEETFYLGFGADWWAQAWLDGKPILEETANSIFPPSKSDLIVMCCDLSKGRHILAVRVTSGTKSSQFAMGPLDEVPTSRGPELTWKPYTMRIGDGKGGWEYRDGEFRFLHVASAPSQLMPFGLAQMDNGQIVLLAGWTRSQGVPTVPVVAFSEDRGTTWSNWHLIPGAFGRPMMLAYLGKGTLTFQADQTRFYSHNYGRTWPERLAVQPSQDTGPWNVEGNALVERDAASGKLILAETGCSTTPGWPVSPSINYIRWSHDGGRTWLNQNSPKEWLWEDTSDDKTYTRGVSEGSLVRADNGWLVAALRPDMPAWWITRGGNDNQEGTGVSISKDNGKTWTPLHIIHPAGRMHAHFVKMNNGDLVMIYIMRQDIAPDGIHYASYRKGCGAVVSRDNGLSWDASREYRLHEFDYATAHEGIGALACGHTCSTLLDDGSILTAYAHYISKGVILIRWKP